MDEGLTAFEQLADREEVFFQNVSAGFLLCRAASRVLIVVVLVDDHDPHVWKGKWARERLGLCAEQAGGTWELLPILI